MYLKTLKFLICCTMALFAIGCEKGGGTDNGGGDNGGGSEGLYEKSGYNVMGTVTCNGKGVANVVVSDGLKVTRTDASGRFWLKCELSYTPEVFISVPSGYETVERKGTGMAFYAYTEKTDKVQTFHFTLKEVDQSNYLLLAIADSHVLGEANKGKYRQGSTEDTKYYNEVFVPAIRTYARRRIADGHTIYAVHCGDMTQASAWGSYGMQEYCDDTKVIEEFPIFNAIGNHDHDRLTANGNQPYTMATQQLSRQSFRKAVGPAYYSFNIGSEHYIVLDSVFITDENEAGAVTIDPLQMSWLKKDIQYIDRKKIKGLVIVMHQAYNSFSSADKAALQEIFKDYPQTYIIGHYHCDRTIIHTEEGAEKPIKEFWVPTLAGVAWLDTICTDGTPRSYNVFEFENGKVEDRKFQTFDEEFATNTKSYRVYDYSSNSAVDYTIYRTTGNYLTREEEAAEQEGKTLYPGAIINAWGAVSLKYTGSDAIDIQRGNIYDLSYRDWYWESHASTERNSIYAAANNGQGPSHQMPNRNASSTSAHIWRINPKTGTFGKTAPVLLKDAQGKETRLNLYLRQQ